MFPQSSFANLVDPVRRTGDSPSILIVAAALAISTSPGTALADEPLRIAESPRLSGAVYRIHQINTEPTEIVAETPGQQISRIKEILAPSIAELAEAIGVSRQSIYKWLKDEPVAEFHASRIHDLVSAADLIDRAGFSADRSILRRRFADGQTLLQFVASGGSAQEAAGKLVAVLQREQAKSDRLSTRLADRIDRAPSPDFDFPAAG